MTLIIIYALVHSSFHLFMIHGWIQSFVKSWKFSQQPLWLIWVFTFIFIFPTDANFVKVYCWIFSFSGMMSMSILLSKTMFIATNAKAQTSWTDQFWRRLIFFWKSWSNSHESWSNSDIWWNCISSKIFYWIEFPHTS